jgi:hypothetical protein
MVKIVETDEKVPLSSQLEKEAAEAVILMTIIRW